jgi:glucose/arabinose dehydrogenase
MKMRSFPAGAGKPFFMGTLFTLLACLVLIIYSCDHNDDDNDTGDLELQLVADGMASPIGLVSVKDNTNRLFIIDQVGKVWIVDGSGNKMATPFIDLTSKIVTLNANYDERGLLGLAFHPQYATNGKFYVYYQLPPRPGGPQSGVNWNNLSRISEFKVSTSNSNQADMGSERILLEMDDPQSNHNGGTLAFGPDGFLYIAIGDGGSANDVAPGHVEDWYATNAGGNGQDVTANLFGDVLRIDVNSGSPYGIPGDNPFVGKEGRDEIYAYGFRNPFRFSFDMGGSHRLILGDAGQVLYEEIDVVNKGGNYGWNVKEGRHCFQAANNDTVLSNCPTQDNFGNPLVDPVIEINNAANPAGGKALTIIGGNVYRGNAIRGLQGKYIFGSYAQSNAPNGELFMAETNGSNWNYEEINIKSNPNDLGYFLKGFGQDNSGEIYLTVSTTGSPLGTNGKVFKLIKAP